MYLDDLKARLWMWGPFLGFGIAVLAVLVFLIPSLFNPEREKPGDFYPYGTPYQLTLPGELRSAYIAANGGEASLKELQSSRSSGVIETSDERAPFTSIKKRPWQSSLNVRFDNYELSTAIDGDTVWQRVTPRGQESVAELKEGKGADQIRQLGAFFDPVMMLLLLGEGTILGLEEGRWESQPAMVLDFENTELSLRATAYIAPSTMHLLARVDKLPDGEQRTLRYSDHRKVLGLIEPFIVETRVDGEFDNRVKIERMEYNVGTLPSFFRYPSAPEERSAQPREPAKVETGESSFERKTQDIYPMFVGGLDPEVAGILNAYYEKNFGHHTAWARVESIRFDGILKLSRGDLAFTAFKKKPDLHKVVLNLGAEERLIMGYDGQDAWQHDSRVVGGPVDMESATARGFIRDALIGGHLLFPKLPGKTIELLGETQVRENPAYELKVTLPDGQVTRYFLDVDSLTEVQKITINTQTGAEEVRKYSDFRAFEGFRVPFQSVLTIDGEEVHRTRLKAVKVNQGVADWMFTRPERSVSKRDNAEQKVP